MTPPRARPTDRGAPSSAPQADASADRRWWAATPWKVAAALAALHLVLALLVYVPMPFAGGDNGAYLALARSLLDGAGYREAWDPLRAPHAQYPPVFPLMLAGAMGLRIDTEPGLKLVVAASSVAAVALSYLWARRVATPGVALAAGAALAISPGVLELTRWILSDVPFWAFAMLALWAFARRVPAADGGAASTDAIPSGDGGGRLWLVLAVAGVLLAYLTRSAGLPLALAAGALLLLRRRWRDAAALAGVMLPAMLAWALYGRATGAPGYLDAFLYVDPYDVTRGTIGLGGLLARIPENGHDYLARRVPELLFGWPAPPFALALGVVFTALAVAGWAMRLRRPGLAELWVPLHVGLILVWPPVWSGERFVLPVLPPMLVYAASALRRAALRFGVRRRFLLPVAAAVALLMAPALVSEVRFGTSCTAAWLEGGSRFDCLLPVWKGYFGLAEAMRGRLPGDAVVVARKPTLLHSTAGYPSSIYPLTDRRDSIFALADSVGAEWVLVDEIPDLSPRYLHPLLFTYRDDFCLVTDLPTEGAFLLRIDRGRTKGTRERGPREMRECPLDPRRITPGLTPGADQAAGGGDGGAPGT